MDKFVKEQSRIAFTRMTIGAVLGFVIIYLPAACLLWADGWFHRVPCFTPPPRLILLSLGTVGAVAGGLLSIFSKNWKKENEEGDSSLVNQNTRKIPKVIIGILLLPYITVALIAITVKVIGYSTLEHQLPRAGEIIFLLPMVTVILSGLFMGFDTIKLHKKSSLAHKILVFLLSFAMTTVLQYAGAIFFFMQTLYMYAGIRH